jgi:hypothetical protein
VNCCICIVTPNGAVDAAGLENWVACRGLIEPRKWLPYVSVGRAGNKKARAVMPLGQSSKSDHPAVHQGLAASQG